MRGVGMSNVSSYKKENNPDFLRLRPEAAKKLEEIADTFQEKLSAAGLSDEWRIRLNINSLVRLQKSGISGSSEYSSHTMGLAFDVAYHFDLINPDTGDYAQLNPGKPKTKYDAAIIQTCLLLLFQTVKELRDKDPSSMLMTLEGNTPFYKDKHGGGSAPHIHIIAQPDV